MDERRVVGIVQGAVGVEHVDRLVLAQAVIPVARFRRGPGQDDLVAEQCGDSADVLDLAVRDLNDPGVNRIGKVVGDRSGAAKDAQDRKGISRACSDDEPGNDDFALASTAEPEVYAKPLPLVACVSARVACPPDPKCRSTVPLALYRTAANSSGTGTGCSPVGEPALPVTRTWPLTSTLTPVAYESTNAPFRMIGVTAMPPLPKLLSIDPLALKRAIAKSSFPFLPIFVPTTTMSPLGSTADASGVNSDENAFPPTPNVASRLPALSSCRNSSVSIAGAGVNRLWFIM
jgi:hypothetical protein